MKKQKLINKGQELLIVDAKLSHLKGNKSPYFSITGMIYKMNEKGERDRRYNGCIVGGCIHDEILKAFPDMKDLIAIHSSAMDGTPTYAVENGYYWLQKDRLDYVAKLLRISMNDAKKLQGLTKEQFIKFVDTQRPRWNKEANDIIQKYQLKIIREG